MSNDHGEKEQTAAEIRLLYRDNLDNIRDLKRQQWLITYYSILVYAALVGIAELAADANALGPWLIHVLSLLPIAVGLTGTSIILKCQASLARRRTWLAETRKRYFTETGQKAYGKPKKHHASFRYDGPIWGMMIAVTLAGAGLVNWVIWWHSFPSVLTTALHA